MPQPRAPRGPLSSSRRLLHVGSKRCRTRRAGWGLTLLDTTTLEAPLQVCAIARPGAAFTSQSTWCLDAGIRPRRLNLFPVWRTRRSAAVQTDPHPRTGCAGVGVCSSPGWLARRRAARCRGRVGLRRVAVTSPRYHCGDQPPTALSLHPRWSGRRRCSRTGCSRHPVPERPPAPRPRRAARPTGSRH